MARLGAAQPSRSIRNTIQKRGFPMTTALISHTPKLRTAIASMLLMIIAVSVSWASSVGDGVSCSVQPGPGGNPPVVDAAIFEGCAYPAGPIGGDECGPGDDSDETT